MGHLITGPPILKLNIHGLKIQDETKRLSTIVELHPFTKSRESHSLRCIPILVELKEKHRLSGRWTYLPMARIVFPPRKAKLKAAVLIKLFPHVNIALF